MGGNALKNTHTRRYTKTEYESLKEEVVEHLIRKTNRLVRVDPIKSFSSKETFGDLDVLIERSETSKLLNVDYRQLVQTFNPNEIVKNGDVYSFDYKDFQIDLIVTDSKFYDFSLCYYSFNDLGNLIGRVAHKMGLTYGHKGLFYKHKDKHGNIQGLIELTVDPKEAVEFLGYDYEKIKKGFDTLDDIFYYVVSSPYFNEIIYDLSHRNHQARTRDRKRPTYTAFLEFVSNHKFENQFVYDSDFEETIQETIKSAFPHFARELEEIKKSQFEKELVKRKFNGVLVNELTGLTGRELGKFMSVFREMNQDLVVLTEEEIKNKILDCCS